MLLGREPADYDVATDATPPRSHAHLSRDLCGGRAVRRGAGARAQAESASADDPDATQGTSAMPAISSIRTTSRSPPFATTAPTAMAAIPIRSATPQIPQEDVQRRDFTINGLLLDPLDGNRVLDFVGGRDDLAGRHHSRHRRSGAALRRRQAAHAAGGALCRALSATSSSRKRSPPSSELAPRIHQVSRERVRDELTKMLTEGHARRPSNCWTAPAC